MSPGLVALLPGMFSAAAMMPTTLIGSCISASASMVPSTLAAPHMSNFISSMPAPGFRLMPPVSKVMPLPTSAWGFSSSSPPRYSITISCEGWALPLPTASSAFMPSSAICSSSSTLTCNSSNSSASACARSAR